MAFDPIKWTYHPPATLPPAPPQPEPPVAPAPRDSRASQLISRLDDLTATAKYLESLIVEKTKNIGITWNAGEDPDLALSLTRIYGSAPPGISVEMYSYLLDAETGISRAEIVLGETGGPYAVDPVQKADIQRVTNTFETALVEDGSYDHQVPLLLRPLKNDRVIFDNVKEGLGEYPVLQDFQAGGAQTIDIPDTPVADPVLGQPLVYEPPVLNASPYSVPSSSSDDANRKLVAQIVAGIGNPEPEIGSQPDPVDVHPDTAANLNERLDVWGSYYNGTMDLVSKIDDVYNDVNSLSQAYLYKPLRDLQYILTTLGALKLFFHKPQLQDLRAGLANLILPRLASELSKFVFMLDRSVQTAVAPVEQLFQSLGRLFGEIRQVGNDAAYLAIQGGFTGMVRNSISGKFEMPAPEKVAKLDLIPAGLAKLSSSLSWGLNEMNMQQTRVETAMMKTLDSKLAGDGDRLEVMQTLKSLDALISLTQTYLDAGYRSVGSGSAGPGPIQEMQSKADQFLQQNSTLPVLQPPAQAQAVFDRAQGKS